MVSRVAFVTLVLMGVASAMEDPFAGSFFKDDGFEDNFPFPSLRGSMPPTMTGSGASSGGFFSSSSSSSFSSFSSDGSGTPRTIVTSREEGEATDANGRVHTWGRGRNYRDIDGKKSGGGWKEKDGKGDAVYMQEPDEKAPITVTKTQFSDNGAKKSTNKMTLDYEQALEMAKRPSSLQSSEHH